MVTSEFAPNQPAIALPAMGCGTWAWGNRLLWDYQPEMDPELQAVFNTCVANGITLFDTGDSYGTGKLKGRSEALLGQFTAAYTGSNRDRLCLATKLAPYPWRLTRGSIKRACAASAERFGRPVDLVQLHWSTANYLPFQETILLEGLGDLFEAGLVRAIGLSNFGPKRLRQAAAQLGDRGIPIATLQVQYSLLSTDPVTQLQLDQVCQELGIQLIAYSPLGLGMLSGKYDGKHPEKPLPQGLRGRVYRNILPKVQPILATVRQIAQAREKTMAQVALNWCIGKGTMPIPGAKTIAQVQENLGALGWRLSEAEMAQLDQVVTNTNQGMVQNPFQSR